VAVGTPVGLVSDRIWIIVIILDGWMGVRVSVARKPARELHHRAGPHGTAGVDAIGAYHQLRQHLTEDLGVDPSPRLQALCQQVLSGDLNVPGPDVTMPAQLPATISDFTGRAGHVAELLCALAGRPPARVRADHHVHAG